MTPLRFRNNFIAGIAFAAIMLLAAGLLWGFGRQLMVAYQMRLEEARLEQKVAAEQARYAELIHQQERVQSDEYIEQWARTEAAMTKPGEVLVVPSAELNAEPPIHTTPAPTQSPDMRPFWIIWLELLFGSRFESTP